MALLHSLAQVGLLLPERDWTGHRAPRRCEEALRTAITNRRRRSGASAGRQARVSWHHGKVPRHHARAPQLLRTSGHGANSARTKMAGIHGRHGVANPPVAEVRHVGVAHSAMQRSNSAIVVDVRDVDVGDVHDAKASAVSAPPRMEPVTRSEREPAEAATSAEADVKAKAPAPAQE